MKSKENRGITLIALVITIIVMLILAGVTINLVLDDDSGIINRSNVSTQIHIDQSQREAIALAYTAAKFEVLTDATKGSKPIEEIDIDLFTNSLIENGNIVEVEEDGNDFLVYFTKTEYLYTVSKGGKILSVSDKATFTSASNPKNYKVENGILTGLSEEGEALYREGKLTRLVVPNTATEIADSAFINRDKITNLIVPNSVTTIGNTAFRNCSSLSAITLSSSVVKIKLGAFYECTNIKKITYTGTSEQWSNLKTNGIEPLNDIILNTSPIF